MESQCDKYFGKSALRVSPAETTLTVYRRPPAKLRFMLTQSNTGAVEFSPQRARRQKACLASEEFLFEMFLLIYFVLDVSRSTTTPLGILDCID